MKKILYIFVLYLFATSIGYSQVTTLWEKSATAGTKPSWDASSATRGIAYGLVNNNHRLFVVSRHASIGGKQIIILNAVTGDSVGILDTTGISGGTLVINDVEVSADGKIFACNLAAGGSFKVYKYDTEASAPAAVINFDATGMRLGDKITVTGSTADNSIIIWAPNATGNGNVLKFKTTDNGLTFAPDTVIKTATGSSASAGPLPNGDFYYNTHGGTPQKFNADGTIIGTVPGSIFSTSGSAIRYLRTLLGDEYVLANELTTVTNNAKILKISGGDPAAASVFGTTPGLGATSAGGLGDVSYQKVSDLVYNVYVLATNNGFGAYQVDLTPVLAGSYYIGAAGTGPGGTDPQFADLREAFDVLNEATFTGDCTFYITSNIYDPFTPATGYGLGLAVNPEPYTITFKPFTGIQPVITLAYPSDGTSGPSGALVIGLPSAGNIAWDSMKTTQNIVIDGSNTVDGTTRDLTIECAVTAQRNGFPLAIVGDVSNMVVKNTNIYYKAQGVSTSGNLFVSAVQVRSRNYGGVDWVPHDLLFENNHISANFDGVVQSAQGYGTWQSGTPLPTKYPYNITLKNNKIEGKRRAVSLYRAGSHDIYNNEIILNQDIAAGIASEAVYAVDVIADSVVNIYNNRFSKVSSISNGASAGNAAISIETLGTYNIYNNFISGFELTAENPVAFLYGVKNSSADAVLNFYHNTIYMDDIANIGTGSVVYNGLLLSNGTNDIKNNIIYSAETDFASFCINKPGTTGSLVSDYNDFYPASTTNGNVGFWNDAATPALTNWQTASNQDASSVSKEVFFVSAADLHLTGTSNGDTDLIGNPISLVTEDIDGDPRSTFFPYKGADEASEALPVELTSFAASVDNGSVILRWSTATEVNNSGFEIQKSEVSGQKSAEKWTNIGFVKGNGTTTQQQTYSFVDKSVTSGSYSYRLKQLDFNGTFSYSSVIDVELTTPVEFDLAQNYPNPFNPTTTIRFSIVKESSVTLTVYNILGEEAMVLINNQLTQPGVHSIAFDGANLASGTYIYRLQAGDMVVSKKMILAK